MNLLNISTGAGSLLFIQVTDGLLSGKLKCQFKSKFRFIKIELLILKKFNYLRISHFYFAKFVGET